MKLSVAASALFVLVGAVSLASVSQNPTSTSQEATSVAKSISLFAYPRNGQSSDQQLKDENACYASAKQQIGIDPQAPPPPQKTAEQTAAEQKAAADTAEKPKGGRARGAARGAAAGATVGAIAGDAGTGAAAGAALGTMKGGAQQRQASKAAQQQAAASTAAQQQKDDEQAKSAHAQSLDTFKRAFAACMDARGYSVK